MNRERAKELLKDAGEILLGALCLKSLIASFPDWDKLGNHFNFVDGVDEIKAKMKVLELFADESTRANYEDIEEVMVWLTQEE